jgi:hypothetical protein
MYACQRCSYLLNELLAQLQGLLLLLLHTLRAGKSVEVKAQGADLATQLLTSLGPVRMTNHDNDNRAQIHRSIVWQLKLMRQSIQACPLVTSIPCHEHTVPASPVVLLNEGLQVRIDAGLRLLHALHGLFQAGASLSQAIAHRLGQIQVTASVINPLSLTQFDNMFGTY